MAIENNFLDTFIASYRITIGRPDQPIVGDLSVTLNLIIDTTDRTVNGTAKIFQSTNPPLTDSSKVSGDFTYLTVMPQNSHVLVTATGYPNLNWNPIAGIGPELLPNFELRMVLEEDWKSGKASFKYEDQDGNWKEARDYYVENINILFPEEEPVLS